MGFYSKNQPRQKTSTRSNWVKRATRDITAGETEENKAHAAKNPEAPEKNKEKSVPEKPLSRGC